VVQLNRSVYEPVKWSVVLVALLGGFLLIGCDRRQQSPPPTPVAEVAVVTVQPEKLILTTELPGRTSAFRVAEMRNLTMQRPPWPGVRPTCLPSG